MTSSDKIGLAIRGARIAQLALTFLQVPWIGHARGFFTELVKALKELDEEISRIEREEYKKEAKP